MIQIGFCDDDLSILSELRVLLDRYRVERNVEIASAAFQSPLELLTEIERGTRFDILLLDVMMPGENGIDTAREIRRYDQSVKIIFLTSSAEFAVESYTVGAYFYQLKPIWQESFFRLLDSVIAECAKSGSMSLILRCKSGITRVELDKLEYSVDVLGQPEPVDSPAQLDSKQYGVIVSSGHRRGLLLPDLDGVDTVEQQLDIARQKGGIGAKDPCQIQRFKVVRHL